MYQPQRAVDILEHPDGVGDHDVIKRALDSRQRSGIFHVTEDKMQIGMQFLGVRNIPGTEIDPDAVRRLQCGEQISAPAA
ncbi:hypothetical protein GALL_533300 [mine drainage metagenome]|uniref:Uncharacterized protein n=1 Tax=mine drainage metagenome TaxID=410659 RepID=A0A1J5PIL2_9ZZZZ